DGAANPTEAANAAFQAHKLLFSHGLTATDVEAAGEAEQVEVTGIELKAQLWRGDLLDIVAQSHFCRVFYTFVPNDSGRAKRSWKIVGTPTNAQTAALSYQYLEDTVERLASAAWTNRTDPQPSDSRTKW